MMCTDINSKAITVIENGYLDKRTNVDKFGRTPLTGLLEEGPSSGRRALPQRCQCEEAHSVGE